MRKMRLRINAIGALVVVFSSCAEGPKYFPKDAGAGGLPDAGGEAGAGPGGATGGGVGVGGIVASGGATGIGGRAGSGGTFANGGVTGTGAIAGSSGGGGAPTCVDGATDTCAHQSGALGSCAKGTVICVSGHWAPCSIQKASSD